MTTHCGLHCLKINHISVRAGEAQLLQDVNLHAHCGELTAIIGRNGAGKSTLLKAILGEIPHTGDIEFSGHDGQPSAKRPRMGYVPQSLDLRHVLGFRMAAVAGRRFCRAAGGNTSVFGSILSAFRRRNCWISRLGGCPAASCSGCCWQSPLIPSRIC